MMAGTLTSQTPKDTRAKDVENRSGISKKANAASSMVSGKTTYSTEWASTRKTQVRDMKVSGRKTSDQAMESRSGQTGGKKRSQPTQECSKTIKDKVMVPIPGKQAVITPVTGRMAICMATANL